MLDGNETDCNLIQELNVLFIVVVKFIWVGNVTPLKEKQLVNVESNDAQTFKLVGNITEVNKEHDWNVPPIVVKEF